MTAPEHTPIDINQHGTGPRSFRVLIDGEVLTLEDSDTPRKFTESAAHKYRDKLLKERHAAEDAHQEARQAKRKALEAQQAAAPVLGVLDTSRRRLDGLTHEEAAARFEAPPPILCVVSTRRQIVLIQGRARGTYTLDKLGQVAAVEIAELDTGTVIYSGGLAGLERGGTKTKYAVKLAPWRRIGMVALARHTPPQGVAG